MALTKIVVVNVTENKVLNAIVIEKELQHWVPASQPMRYYGEKSLRCNTICYFLRRYKRNKCYQR